jgi:hypothetical protein
MMQYEKLLFILWIDLQKIVPYDSAQHNAGTQPAALSLSRVVEGKALRSHSNRFVDAQAPGDARC